MVRDILIDIDSTDVRFAENLDKNSLIFGTVWGDLFEEDKGDNITYLNVVVPTNYTQFLIYNTNNSFQCNIKADYHPVVGDFYVRFVICINNIYSKIDNIQLPELSQAKTYNYGGDSLMDLTPPQLMLINKDGYYTLLFKREVVYNIPNVEVYSMAVQDLLCDKSDDQSAKLLAECAPGKNYRYPTTGVGITDYINGVVENSDLGKILIDEFQKNMTPVQDVEFDSTTGNLVISQSHEQEEDLDVTLPKEELDMDLISSTDDENLRYLVTDTIDSDVDYVAFLNEIAEKNDIYFIYGLEGAKLNALNDSSKDDTGYSFVKDGFEGHYSEIDKPGYCIVTANLKKNDIVRFKLTDGVPVVFITKSGDIAENESFDTKRVNLFNREEYGSCGIVKEECYIHYCIKKDEFKTGDCGVFKMNIQANALQDLLVVVQDVHTGRLLGYVTQNSSISNVQMHKITGQIFLTKITNNE